ncbi:alkaline phosphatase family protein [Halomicroarcula sp. F13]|uniref:Alkaline phosphatase family protein n=1 Tax=Haloarcula rubra TaxID=2487747 RepID=A0AAW4Q0L8_9EURY|nr:alkaline phosphatase family protein [Halomicroarcula rubra]MBX0325912.1 alkaline phosphatase family protein [Halomicroarcula rubra]
MGRTVILGLDGFHNDLLDFTPAINDLYESYPSARLESTIPPVTAPAWAGFQTGKNQGKHGIFDFVTYSENFSVSLLDGRSLDSVTFYELLSEEGYTCYLQNLPFSLPPRIEGDIMPSWLDGDGVSPQPDDLCDRLGVEKPRYPELDGSDTENVAEMRDTFRHNKDTFLSVLNQEEHDFLFHLVSVTDWLQHAAYLSLIQNPQSDVAKRAKKLLADVDEYVERVSNDLDDTDDLILLSDHGFRVFDDYFFVNDWLQESGYLKQSRHGTTFENKSKELDDTEEINVGVFGQLIRQSPFLLRAVKPVKRAIENLSGKELKAEPGIDLSESVAYCRSKDECAIRVNNDVVSESETLKEEIQRRFDDVEDIAAYLDREVYSGPHVEAAGDVILSSAKYKISRGPRGEVHSGNSVAHHGQYGILVGVGPSFHEAPSDPHLLDVAPTLLHQFSLPVPEDIDGRVLTEWLDDNTDVTYRSSNDTSYSFFSKEATDEGVEDRLENLGYL